MIEVGQCIRVQTKTLMDVFGVCFYEILETGLEAPEKERKGQMDGIKARMLGGSGPSAREGIVIHDSWHKINAEIKSGIIEVMSKEQAEKLLKSTPKQVPTGGSTDDTPRPSTGVVEMD
jgi:hypothetical protein